jgi:hypothetical protein
MVNVLDAFYPVSRFICYKDRFLHTTVFRNTTGKRYMAVPRRSAIFGFFFVSSTRVASLRGLPDSTCFNPLC